MHVRSALIATLAAVALQACAGSSDGPSPALADAPAPGPGAKASGEKAAGEKAPAYVLNAEELALDCKKLTGRMQVRILQVRDYRQRETTTLLSRGMQVATTTVIGGTNEGVFLDSRYEKDLAMLEAYNRQLAAKQCKTFDLEAELKTQSVTHLPTPKPKPEPETKQ